MTDYQTQYSSDLLTPINPSQDSSIPLEISPSDNFNGTNPANNIIYKTPSTYFFVPSIVIFISGLFTTGILIFEGMTNSRCPVYFSLLLFILIIIGYSIGSLASNSTKIHIDNSIGIITITEVKTFSCFNVSLKIQIKEIKQVIIRKKNDYDDDSTYYNIFFKLLNGNEVEVSSSEKNEIKKAFNIIRSGLPQNIIFNDDLVH